MYVIAPHPANRMIQSGLRAGYAPHPYNMAADEYAKQLKARANALFREGDHRGAVNTFRLAIEAVHQVSSPSTEQAARCAEMELACLCNLALACIKLGLMEQAEEACCRALKRWPSCTKALFRRGQARLGLSRPIEAAIDFREVAILEPTNAEVIKMLRRAEDESVGPSEVHPSVSAADADLQQSNGGSTSKASGPKKDVNNGNAKEDEKHDKHNISKSPPGTALSRLLIPENEDCPDAETLVAGTTAHGANAIPAVGDNVKRHDREDSSKQRQSGDFLSFPTSSISGFMVSGWLNSEERKHAEQLQHCTHSSAETFVDAHLQDIGGESCDGAKIRSGDGGNARVSKVVSELKVRKGSKPRKAPCKVHSTVAQSEWSRLQSEETHSVRAFRRLSAASHADKKTGKAARKQVVGQRENKRGGKSGATITLPGSPPRGKTGGGEWESMQDEEKHVRDAFRAKLGIGKNNKTKNMVLRLGADVPP